MIYTKDGLTKEKLIELLQYSLQPECQYLALIKITGGDGILIDKKFQEETVIKLLKVEEKLCEEYGSADGTKVYSYGFFVKVMVEDNYWVLSLKHGDTYFKSGRVSSRVHNRVAEILNS